MKKTLLVLSFLLLPIGAIFAFNLTMDNVNRTSFTATADSGTVIGIDTEKGDYFLGFMLGAIGSSEFSRLKVFDSTGAITTSRMLFEINTGTPSVLGVHKFTIPVSSGITYINDSAGGVPAKLMFLWHDSNP